MSSPSHQPASPTSSIPSGDGGQHTPTFHQRETDGVPDRHILEWDIDDVASYVASIGLEQYRDSFLGEDVDGEALIHLDHDELRELGIKSVGHRLSILKSVYNVKIAHGVPIESDNYVPVSADADENEKAATQYDIQRLIGIIRRRDERINQAETELREMQKAFSKLREELLPVWRLIKDKNKALPTPSSQAGSYGSQPPLSTPLGYTSEPSASSRERDRERDRERETERREQNKREREREREEREQREREAQSQEPPFTSSNPNPNLLPAPSAGKGLSRKFSMKKLILGTPKNASPTHPTYPETAGNGYEPPPMGAVTNGNGTRDPRDTSPAMPSPTSPSTIHHLSGTSTVIPNHTPGTGGSSHRPTEASSRRPPRNEFDDPSGTSGGGSNSVEIFKSFRVSMEDPCYKVLPAALKRYNIQADWRQYALYIVHGDQERCLGLDEKPLILFKQLDREGRKPMFMLRRNGNFEPGGVGGVGGMGGVGGSSGASVYGGREQGIALPGGVLPGGVL